MNSSALKLGAPVSAQTSSVDAGEGLALTTEESTAGVEFWNLLFGTISQEAGQGIPEQQSTPIPEDGEANRDEVWPESLCMPLPLGAAELAQIGQIGTIAAAEDGGAPECARPRAQQFPDSALSGASAELAQPGQIGTIAAAEDGGTPSSSGKNCPAEKATQMPLAPDEASTATPLRALPPEQVVVNSVKSSISLPDKGLASENAQGIQAEPPLAATPEEDAATDLKTDPEHLGTTAAQEGPQMKRSGKVIKFAESHEQQSPVTSGEPTFERNLFPLGGQDQVRSAIVAPVVEHTSSGAVIVESAEGRSPSTAEPERLLTLERTHELIATHAIRLRELQGRSMRVVIEPGSDLKMSLELHWGERGIEAQAHLHRGDHQFFSQQWSELQQRLESRGVFLGALKADAQTSGDHRRQHSHESDTAPEPLDFNGRSTGSRSVTASRRLVTATARGWETWA